MAAFAALGAVLLAGLQLTDLGSTNGLHRLVAIGSALFALLLVEAVVIMASLVLTTPRAISLAQLVEQELVAREKAKRTGTDPISIDPFLYAVHLNRRSLLGADISGPHELHNAISKAHETEERETLRDAEQRLSDFASRALAEKRYGRLRLTLIFVIPVITALILTFAVLTSVDDDVVITEPRDVRLVLKGTAEALSLAGLAESCPSELEGVAVGGTWDEPLVLTVPDEGCPGTRVVVSKEVGLAIPQPP